MICWTAILAAIELVGVTGSDLRARAFFDANNVKVGDPLVLTIDFIGEAEFRDLHPPALSKAVDRRDWKLDDVSAKTDTFRDARRLTYRVRPMREGVLWFPSLEFEYADARGEKRRVRANEIPVHAKAGEGVVVAELGEDANEMPAPPELTEDWRRWTSAEGGASPLRKASRGEAAPSPLGQDDLFRWKKAMAKPTADAFAEFDYPAAKMNEATCAIREGNWARALKIYQKLEWTTGQAPDIEKGIVAALALRYDNPAVELPVWRQVLRPILRFGWKGRVGLVLGGFAALAVLFWLLGRGIRAVACVALVVGFAAAADAQGLFEQMEQEMERMRRQMGSVGANFGKKVSREPAEVRVSFTTNKKTLQVGDPFEFVLSIEYPRTASVGEIHMTPSTGFGLKFTGRTTNLTDGRSANTNNVVKRIAIPARYDVPFKGRLAFAVDGMVSTRAGGGNSFFSFSSSFRATTDPVAIDVRPLPSAGQPADFSGIVSEGLRVHEYPEPLVVETNDVVTLVYRMHPNGYVPPDFLPKDAAFEWTRQQNREGEVVEIEYRRYFVADGSPATPVLVIPYYDPRTKTYNFAKTGGTPLKYTH